MEESLTRQVLEHVAEFGKLMVDAFFPPGYPGTGLARGLVGLDRPCRHKFSHSRKKTISTLLSRLKQEGLVSRGGSKRNSYWMITRRGRLRLQDKRGRKKVNHGYILPEPDGKTRLITFDVPERERKKRDWLRLQLVACDFHQLHKSVWMGGRPLPEDFIQELDKMQLASCVHIVSIDGRGTLLK